MSLLPFSPPSVFVLLKQVEEKNAEMQVLKRTGEELSQGQSRLKELVERMKREEEEVDRDTAILQQKKVVASLLRDFSSLTRSPFQSELETLQERAAEEEPLDPDEAVEVPHSSYHPTGQPQFFSSSGGGSPLPPADHGLLRGECGGRRALLPWQSSWQWRP